MKIRVLSDLHLEFRPWTPSSSTEDVIILAGDTHLGLRGIEWAMETFPTTRILYIFGNHEFYKVGHPKLIRKAVALTENTNVTVLENRTVTIDGITFIGCTLWTDFALVTNPKIAGIHCSEIMTDFRKIRLTPSYKKFRSIDAVMLHQHSIDWLENEIRSHNPDKTIVITHHAPHPRSLPVHLRDNLTSSAYASDLSPILNTTRLTWIHGHIHTFNDYIEGKTRVISNPRGYPDENSGFKENFIFEI